MEGLCPSEPALEFACGLRRGAKELSESFGIIRGEPAREPGMLWREGVLRYVHALFEKHLGIRILTFDDRLKVRRGLTNHAGLPNSGCSQEQSDLFRCAVRNQSWMT